MKNLPWKIFDVPKLIMSFTPPLATHGVAVERLGNKLGDLLRLELHPAFGEQSVSAEFAGLTVILLWLQEHSSDPEEGKVYQ